MNKKFVYQVGNNKKVILWCTANQTSIIRDVVCSWYDLWLVDIRHVYVVISED